MEGTLDKRAIGAEDGRLLDAIVQTNGPEKGAKFLRIYTIIYCSMYSPWFYYWYR